MGSLNDEDESTIIVLIEESITGSWKREQFYARVTEYCAIPEEHFFIYNHYMDSNYVFMHVFWGKKFVAIGCRQSSLNK